jgi:uncharacterized protein (DUF2384 family)
MVHLEMLFPILVIGLIVVWWGYRYLRFGSLVGLIVGARVARTIGKVESQSSMGVRRELEVHVLEPEPGQVSMVAVAVTSRTWGSRKYSAFKLSGEQARRLAQLLEQAATR